MDDPFPTGLGMEVGRNVSLTHEKLQHFVFRSLWSGLIHL